MNKFLSQVADRLLTKHQDHLGDCTVVFPNRRAGLFLKKYLSKKIDSPVWSPNVKSLEDFILPFSSVKKTDTLSLIFELFEAFKKSQLVTEGFEAFYFWSEMLLRDFEEVDHYLVDPKQLFHHVKSDRQIAEDFYFLDPAQEKIIQRFWQEFFPTASKSQQDFMETWRILSPVYESFKERLTEARVGYTSMIYRSLSENIEDLKPKVKGPLVFAGFNALTPVEEKLIKYFVQEYGAELIWDVDSYYLTDEKQEAGSFLRKYQKDTLLGKDFPSEVPEHVQSEKQVDITGVSLEVGQAKTIGEQVAKLISSGEARPDEIVIVLPQDYMLFPVLNAIPPEVDKLNVTMGYPLKETPLFGLLEAALEIQDHKQLTRENWLTFYHKPVLDVLSHPYLYNQNEATHSDLIAFIKKNNQIRVVQQDLVKGKSTVLRTIFREPKEDEGLAGYLKSIVEVLGKQMVERFGLERKFLYHFQQMLSRLDEIVAKQTIEVDLKTFKSLFRKAARSVKIPFSGEPVEGLQVMGVLETRNLDFRHVFMLNMNEDIFPASQRQGSFIPYRIRKAFDLPTFEVQDAIYAYLFYRLFQYGKKLSFYYNMFADFGLSGELSRFLRQIEQESGLKVSKHKLSNPVQIRESTPISIDKTEDILDKLERYTDREMYPNEWKSKLSPSALNVYIECRLQFYFKYVLRMFTNDELNDELTPRDFGNVLHKVMEILYEDATKDKPNRVVEVNDFFRLKNSVSGAIDKSFHEQFKLKDKQKFVAKGRNVVMAEVIQQFVDKALALDEAYAPFEIRSLENDKDGNYDRSLAVKPNGREFNVHLKGVIDRVDRKNGLVRVIDYKSGRDKTEIDSVSKVFDRRKVHRNKAGFQTLYYAWLYAGKHGTEELIVPGILNIQELFTPDFDERLKIKGQPISDARIHLREFEERFTSLLSEIFSMDQPFDQTDDLGKCQWCDFKGICGR